MVDIAIRNLQKTYGGVEVFRDINLDVRDKEFLVLVGPSGCGKSTLLRMIAGLEEVTDGAILFAERDVTDLAPKDRDIAMVFQNYALYPHMTVARNMAFGLKMRGVSQAEIRQSVERAADMLGLGKYLDRYPRQLSGGQRQRVAMGRAIVRTPQVFLFDEPLSNLDALLRVDMRTEVKSLHKRLNATFVYVTHDQIEAMTMADRMVVMHDGVIEQVGRPLEVYDQPANVFVAGFIGSPAMNMVEASMSGDATLLRSADGLVFLPPSTNPADARRVVVGFRPQDLKPATPDLPAAIAATVELVEQTGTETLVYLRAGERRLCMALGQRDGVDLTGTVHIRPDPARTHYFDAATGLRITMGGGQT
jgi:multiple sugar transport system ATP-binding protein